MWSQIYQNGVSCLELHSDAAQIGSGVNILPKERIFSPMLLSCDHKVSPFLPQFCDYMRGSVAMKPLTAWGPGARLGPLVGSRGKAPVGGPGALPPEAPGF